MGRLAHAASPLLALLAVVGLVFLGEVVFVLVTAQAHPGAVLADARIAIQRMYMLAWAIGGPISILAWFLHRQRLRVAPALGRAAMALAGLATVAWGVAVAWPVRAPSVERPDVLLIVVDTLRADYVTEERTPVMVELAAEGVSFPDAYTSAPWTLPSFGTILTGRHPRDHGVGVDGDRGSATGVLRPGISTLAERFRDAGYQTISLTTNPHLGRRSGLDRGFEIYRNLMRDDALFFVTFPLTTTSRFAPASLQTSRALTWLGLRDVERPMFMMLHYMDPHLPRDPDDDLVALERARAGRPPAEAEAIYGATVRVADAGIGALLRSLEASRALDRTLVILTSDHGEGLEAGKERWDHGNTLYPELVRAPLTLRLPNADPSGVTCPGVTSHLDLGATVLQLVGLPATLGLGRPLLGTDGACLPPRDVAYQSMTSSGPVRDGVVTRQLGLIWSRPDTWDAFDRRVDPEYRSPLPQAPEALMERLRGHIDDEAQRAANVERAPPAELPPETVEQLKALGYMD